jgi:hypothetical protein
LAKRLDNKDEALLSAAEKIKNEFFTNHESLFVNKFHGMYGVPLVEDFEKINATLPSVTELDPGQSASEREFIQLLRQTMPYEISELEQSELNLRLFLKLVGKNNNQPNKGEL